MFKKSFLDAVVSRQLSAVVLLLVITSCLIGSNTSSQTIDNRPDKVVTDRYSGPRFYGNLPAIFDDFDYESFDVSREANIGSLFGENEWNLRQGVSRTRAWYRYNRDDLPIPAHFTRLDSTMRIFVPEGHSAAQYSRDPAIVSGFTTREGTYYARVRFSSLWEGQKVRQAFWAYSPDVYIFEASSRRGKVRYEYWSEIDFEYNNHFHGSPDWLPRMDVGNHFGYVDHGKKSSSRERLSRRGTTRHMDGRGIIHRNKSRAFPGKNRDDGLFLGDKWIDLIITVDSNTETVTYQVFSVDDEAIQWQPVEVDADFFPRRMMASIFSLHWTDPQGTLRNTLSLEVDWFYYTPVTGQSHRDLEEEVRRFQEQGLTRVNTTDRPTFEEHNTFRPAIVTIRGPETLTEGETGHWKLEIEHTGTRFLVDSFYRERYRDGRVGAWKPHHDEFFTYTAPRSSSRVTGLELKAQVRDLWYPAPNESLDDNGWRIPWDRCHQMDVTHSVSFE